ncbi:RNA ligase [Candidatus Methylacidithermus pantelleriae]|uniref:Putative DNA ligase (ATP) n=1 Tax=Candidatus Methylacidithermus pantelleriae TaxID=2744239 RepID=A0A8J2BS76_9BACT|nr:RNA ligase [Candidatus Methylacidithermus pantelleriae]CAF0703567.1 putative DNA ligase (ATP) [Candidatus Methylacidithermus pantelleriae]
MGQSEALWEPWILTRRATRENWKDISYVRLATDVGSFPKGTVGLADRIVYGYPKIPRIEVLEKGLRTHFTHPFWVEEKVDGYNVRVVCWEGELLALTRGGFVCPFTTDRAGDWIDREIFREIPDVVLCGEVVGPDNPYVISTSPLVERDARFFLFDVMRMGSQEFVPHELKQELARRFGIDLVPLYGQWTTEDIPRIREIIVELNRKAREGVIFKEAGGRSLRAKYVTASSDLSDIAAMGERFYDVHPSYFTSRILRLVLFLSEIGGANPLELETELGRALVRGYGKAVKEFLKHGQCGDEFRCRFRNPENAERLIQHLHKVEGEKSRTLVRELKQEGDFWVLRFYKVYSATTDLLRNLWEGLLRFD